MRGARRDVGVHVLEASGLQSIGILDKCLRTLFRFAVADEGRFHEAVELLWLCERAVLRLRIAERTATENADMRERLEMRQPDVARLHAAHRESRHRAMFAVRDRAVVRVDHRDDVLQQDVFEFRETHSGWTSTAWRTAGTARGYARSRDGRCRRRSGSRPWRGRRCRSIWRWCSGGRIWGDEVVSRWAAAAATRLAEKSAAPAVVHDDDHRSRFPVRDQVVQNKSGAALNGPGSLVLARAVLEVEHGISCGRVLVVIRRRVDERTAPLFAHGRKVRLLAHGAMRDVLGREELHVIGRHVDRTHPTARAEEGPRVRIGDPRTVDDDLIIVKTLDERGCDDRPRTVLLLRDG